MPHAQQPDPQHTLDPVRRALREIARRDGEVQAFVHQCDPAAASAASVNGALAGLTLGVKDVIDVAGMPTRGGSLATDADPKTFDAACVAQLRQAGAAPVGKTVTAEFAYMAPGPTRNPHRPTHTPGGSSSGSAAAVAAGMVDVALGTQTGGSIIRPAAYCGVVGFKPTFGRVHRGGMQVLCDSIDTLGWFTRTAQESLRIASVLLAGAPAPTPAWRAPKVAFLPCGILGDISPAAREAMHDCVAKLERLGATVVRPDLDADLQMLTRVHADVMRYELSRGMLPIMQAREALLSQVIRDTIHAGLAISSDLYVHQQHLRARLVGQWQDLLADIDFIVAPSAPGEAPAGLASTGTSIFNRVWTLAGFPCIHLPTASGAHGLPVGVQWIARPDMDMALLQWAVALHAQVDRRAGG